MLKRVFFTKLNIQVTALQSWKFAMPVKQRHLVAMAQVLKAHLKQLRLENSFIS